MRQKPGADDKSPAWIVWCGAGAVALLAGVVLIPRAG
jgi:hypothetical protein